MIRANSLKDLSIYLLFTLLALGCLHPWVSPGIALIAGFIVAGIGLNPANIKTKYFSKLFIAWSIIGLGATVSIPSILSVSETYFWLTVSSIILAISAGLLFGKLLKVPQIESVLIGTGTAICGASAIAAVGSAINAKSEQLSISLAVVLILNAIALYLFPYIGGRLSLSGHDFSVWAALAIHDTSSVIGATLQYNKDFIETATTIKLARAIWIAPVAVFFSWYLNHDKDKKLKFNLPWFIWGYLIAACVVTIFPLLKFYSVSIGMIARKGFVIGLFLTGSSIDPRQLKDIKLNSFVLGLILWCLSSLYSLLMILY